MPKNAAEFIVHWQRVASEHALRIKALEQAERQIARDRDHWKRRALAAEVALSSLGTPIAGVYPQPHPGSSGQARG
jgi:hypothetical protein